MKKERIEIESETVEVDLNVSSKLHKTLSEKGETSKTIMQIVGADDNDSGMEYDPEYMKYLTSFYETLMQIAYADDSDSDLECDPEYMEYLARFNHFHERDTSPTSTLSEVIN